MTKTCSSKPRRGALLSSQTRTSRQHAISFFKFYCNDCLLDELREVMYWLTSKWFMQSMCKAHFLDPFTCPLLGRLKALSHIKARFCHLQPTKPCQDGENPRTKHHQARSHAVCLLSCHYQIAVGQHMSHARFLGRCSSRGQRRKETRRTVVHKAGHPWCNK